jgi:hypothetical protein
MVNGEGAQQQTAAAQMILRKLVNGNGTGRRRSTTRPSRRKAARPAARRASARPRRGIARLVKGSAAAKRYMASIRRKRRR